jgi:predicted phosphodiesterase
MRYAIFSDIHSNLEALETVLEAYQEERIDEYICIGDVVGYAANPNECIEKVRKVAVVTLAGNHDWAAVNLFPTESFNPEAQEAIFWTRDNLTGSNKYFLKSLQLVYDAKGLVLVHGSLDNPRFFNYLTNVYGCAATFELLLDRSVCFVGHTHVPLVFIQDKQGNTHYQDVDSIKIEPANKYIINVGSVGQPRDSIPQAAYCIFDTESQEVWIKRIKYDVFKARRKIIEAGLPPFLGDRLLTGN